MDMSKRGKFIVIEGVDGVGKSELAEWLAHELAVNHQIPTLHTHEPGSLLEVQIRELFKREGGPPGPEHMTVMFTADRLIHMEQTIEPALADGQTVVGDRHKLSTLVYQVHNGADPDFVAKACDIPQPPPDLTIILDIEPHLARERMSGRKLDSYEKDVDGQVKMRQSYLDNRDRFGPSIVIEAHQDRDTVRAQALAAALLLFVEYTAEDAEQIWWGDHEHFDHGEIEEQHEGSGRWHQYKHRIYRRSADKSYWAISASIGSTEYQDDEFGEPYRVRPVTKTEIKEVTRWVRTESH